MGDFTADWLGLREPLDARSRDAGLLRLLGTWAGGRSGLRILDLGCGSGANLRVLAPALGANQRWTALDHDPALLARLPGELAGPGWRALVSPLEAGLTELDAVDGGAAPDLVTGSALLDLVSQDWLAGLVERYRGSAFYFALSVEDRVALAPAHPADDAVLEAFAADLRRDKGLGPALGGRAPAVAERLLQAAGHRVAAATSDWQLAEGDEALAEAWLRGVAAADAVFNEVEESTLMHWQETHLSAIAAGRSRILVGHRDLLALPV